MKMTLIIPLLFLTAPSAFAIDSLSFTRELGTRGELGNETLLLICVKDRCHLSASENDQVSAKKELKFSEVKEYFEQAKMAVQARLVKAEEKSATHFVLEYQGKTSQSNQPKSDLLALESKLRARLRP